MEAGRQFQIVGAATEKALQAVTDFLAETVGTDSLFIDDERRDLATLTFKILHSQLPAYLASSDNFEQMMRGRQVAVNGEF